MVSVSGDKTAELIPTKPTDHVGSVGRCEECLDDTPECGYSIYDEHLERQVNRGITAAPSSIPTIGSWGSSIWARLLRARVCEGPFI